MTSGVSIGVGSASVLERPSSLMLHLPAGSRVVVFSDLRLTGVPTESSEIIAAQLGLCIDGLTGEGAVILNGDTIDLQECDHHDPAQALAAHPRLLAALRNYAAKGDGFRVILVAGVLDAAVLEAGIARRRIETDYRFEVVESVELVMQTGSGTRRVLVEHGHHLSPSLPPDHTSPGPEVATTTPGPSVEGPARADPRWLDGARSLVDRIDVQSFVRSRLFYRRVLGPVGLLVVSTSVIAGVIAARAEHARGRFIALSLVLTAAVLIIAAQYVVQSSARKWMSLWDGRETDPNRPGRRTAEALSTSGWQGYVTGHTLRPELSDLGDGCFYANSGSSGDVTVERRARLGLPPVYGSERQVCWVEFESAAELQTRLVLGRTPILGATILEGLARRSHDGVQHTPGVVAALPPRVGGATPSTWPGGPTGNAARLMSVRRRSAAGLAIAGAVNLVSALTPPGVERAEMVLHWIPLTVEEAATALTALGGIVLLVLASGVRRGQHRAWMAAILLVAVSSFLHLVKGLDAEEAAVGVAMATYMFVHRDAFLGSVDRTASRRAVRVLTAAVMASIAIAVTVTAFSRGPSSRLAVPTTVLAVLERLVGISTIRLGHLDRVLRPALAAIGFGSLVTAGWLGLRPHRQDPEEVDDTEQRARGRDLVRRYGCDTLAFFALRDDKQLFFDGDTVVAYAVRFGVCLVSPDPIGPVNERSSAWQAFESFAHTNGWTIAVMGVSSDWLPVYRSSGMRDVYIGDEAIVDCRRFTLEGGHNKSLRHGVNKVRKLGYTVTFIDPSTADEQLRNQLGELMGQSRRGDVERGFSMTLGRIFDVRDTGLLLAVCTDPAGLPAAFCQYTPAEGIDGYSLDLMRRSRDDSTNGLTDFVVVETICHLAALGRGGLGLNFATMRSIIAGEVSDSPFARVQRVALTRMSSSMQIESLWRYNSKFNPDWVPRYAVFESFEHLLPAALAVASAESWWELPIVGRLLR